MPTLEQWKELREYCSWDYVVQNGVFGALFVSYANGNYIFLSCTGYTLNDTGRFINTEYNVYCCA